MKARIKKNDTVEVIAGNDKGSSGKVLKVNLAKETVVVEGVRVQKKHQKQTREDQEAGIIDQEGPIHISNVKLLEKGKS